MTRRSLSEWAAVAEIVASIGVVVSLLFVGYSIQKNTEQLYNASSNDLFDALREVELHTLAPHMAEIIVKVEAGKAHQLSAVEQYQFDQYISQVISIWEQAADAHEAGTMNELDYRGWEIFFETMVDTYISPEQWRRLEKYFDEDVNRLVKQRINQ